MKKMNLAKLSLASIGSVGIIISIVAIFTWRSFEKDEEFISSLYFEKGATTIHLMERILSSRMPNIGNNPLQILAEELINDGEFTFVTLTDKDGKIIIHSDPSFVGQNLDLSNVDSRLQTNDTPKRAKLAQVKIQDKPNYVVYKELTPFVGSFRMNTFEQERSRSKKHHRENNSENNSEDSEPIFRINNQEYESVFAFIGQDATLQTLTSKRSKAILMLLSCAILFVALVLFTLLQYAQRNRELHKRHIEAQILADEMVAKIHSLEKDLRQKEKLAAIGDLVAGVAHEIRNPLSSIKGYATFFKQKFSADSNEKKAAKIMIEEIERLNRAIDDLIGVNNSTEVRLQKTYIDEICKKICLLLNHEAKQKNINLLCHEPQKSKEDDFLTMADPDRFTQAVLNITLNALESFTQEKEDKEVSIELSKTDEEIIIKIEDNGTGIPEDIISRIFDPYFTTKNQGTGLGLVMSKNIIDAHNAELELSSSEDGTVFKIILPI